jgi:hypothetical protein
MCRKARNWHKYSTALEWCHHSPTKKAGPDRDTEGRGRDKESEGSTDGMPGKLDKVADNTEKADLVRHLEMSVFPTTVSDQSSGRCFAHTCKPAKMGTCRGS